MVIDLGFHFQNCKHFQEYFGFYLLTTVYNKKQSQEVLFNCLFAKLQRQRQIFVFRNRAVKRQHVSFANEPFLRRMLVLFFSSNIPLENPMEKLCKVLEVEIKTYTQATQNSFSKKSNIKFCIIFNMISLANAQSLVKIRLACSKVSLVIN